MADEATPTPPEGEPQHDAGDQDLGDGGKKALDAERRRAGAAEKALKQLQVRLDEVEAEKLSKEEKAEKRATEAEGKVVAMQVDVWRSRAVARNGLSDEDGDFITGTDEATINTQAERLAARIKAEKPDGLYVPAEGRQPSPPALNSNDLESALKSKLGIR